MRGLKNEKNRSNRGLTEGLLLALFPVLTLFSFLGTSDFPPYWRFACSLFSSLGCLVCALTLYRNPRIGKFAAIFTLLSFAAVLFPYAVSRPFVALPAGLILVFCSFQLYDFNVKSLRGSSTEANVSGKRVLGAAGFSFFFTVISAVFIPPEDTILRHSMLATMGVVTQLLFALWAWTELRGFWKYPVYGWNVLSLLLLGGASFFFRHMELTLLFSLLPVFALSARIGRGLAEGEHWWTVLLTHPARLLLTTFLLLCVAGTFLLSLPGSTTHGISILDAAFTSVSAVCVTGLVVLDTAKDFTGQGQFILICLIQLGGLGIMSITAAAIYAAGKRLSLNQELMVREMTYRDDKTDLSHVLYTILRYTFCLELIGGIILSLLFLRNGMPFGKALAEGFFTSISAFCNAGFSLNSANLVAYQQDAFILNTVALLIIFGGIAPSVSILLPKWIRRKQVPLGAELVFVTTLVLIVAGTFFMLVFEWNGVLKDLNVWAKLNNAFFQSVTLRTAGFNSVDIGGISSPTVLMMVFLMFVGGSPGGTAGGIKTTVLAIFTLTFWNNIMNRNENVCRGRNIPPATLAKAITIVFSYALLLSLVILMLITTQNLPTKTLIFEATSAIGTVGLSMNTSPLLDEVGRLLIIFTMFAGRVGPMTLFMLLAEQRSDSRNRYPDANLQLT